MKKYALAFVTILLISVIGAVNIFAVPGVKLNKKIKHVTKKKQPRCETKKKKTHLKLQKKP